MAVLQVLISVALSLSYLQHVGAATDLSQRTTCRGATIADTLSTSAGAVQSEEIRKRYAGCQVVLESLIVERVEDDDRDLSFLNDIEEVLGFVWIAKYKRSDLGLRNLRLVHGRQLHLDKWAIHVQASDVLRSVDASSLAEVSRGAVRFDAASLPHLCYVQTLPWADILNTRSQLSASVIMDDASAARCTANNRTCAADCANGCWSGNAGSCSTLSSLPCNSLCGHRCRNASNSSALCCHDQCAAGCTGPLATDCLACRNFVDGGTCVNACPPLMVYDAALFKEVQNPRAKYANGLVCVAACPSHLYVDGSNCATSCSSGTQANGTRCVPCDGVCSKTCNGSDSIPGDSLNMITDESRDHLETYRNCTHIRGSLRLTSYSWVTGVTMDDLEVFKDVKVIDQYLYFGSSQATNVTSLSFLESLQEIRGTKLFSAFNFGFGVYMVTTGLENLALKSLQFIGGNVLSSNSKQLCYADTVNASYVAPPPFKIYISGNKNRDDCVREGHACHPACLPAAGCWAAGPDQCVRCRYRKVGDTCTVSAQCPKLHFSDGDKCTPCHSQCLDGCTGQGAGQCVGCRLFMDGPYCVQSCPLVKYPDSNGTCQLCSPVCNGGCSGGATSLGPGGCNACFLGVQYADGTTQPVCLNHPKPIDPTEDNNNLCPGATDYLVRKAASPLSAGSTPQWYCRPCIGVLSNGACTNCPSRMYTANSSCHQCHPQCAAGCSGPGDDQCVGGCRNVEVGARCTEQCPAATYRSGMQCLPCHSLCTNCTGPLVEDCTRCLYVQFEGVCARCPSQTYFNATGGSCGPCHPQCLACEGPSCSTCSGPTASDCAACANFQEGQLCVASCTLTAQSLAGGLCEPTTGAGTTPNSAVTPQLPAGETVAVPTDSATMENVLPPRPAETPSANALISTNKGTQNADIQTVIRTNSAEKQTFNKFNWIPIIISICVFVILVTAVWFMLRNRKSKQQKIRPAFEEDERDSDDSDDETGYEVQERPSRQQSRISPRLHRQNSDIMLDVASGNRNAEHNTQHSPARLFQVVNENNSTPSVRLNRNGSPPPGYETVRNQSSLGMSRPSSNSSGDPLLEDISPSSPSNDTTLFPRHQGTPDRRRESESGVVHTPRVSVMSCAMERSATPCMPIMDDLDDLSVTRLEPRTSTPHHITLPGATEEQTEPTRHRNSLPQASSPKSNLAFLNKLTTWRSSSSSSSQSPIGSDSPPNVSPVRHASAGSHTEETARL